MILQIFFFIITIINAQNIGADSYLKNDINLEKSIKIVTQTWMTQNLNVSTFRNGDYIKEVKNKEEWIQAGKEKIPAYCYYEYNSKNDAKYGKLYNWYAVNSTRGIAPKGWHIPNDTEWLALIYYLGGQYSDTKNDARQKLKSKTGWNDNGWKKNRNGNNLSGFSGLPGGTVGDYSFSGMGYRGYWWSSTDRSEDPRVVLVSNLILSNNDDESSFPYMGHPSQGCSVRCIKD